MRRIRMRRLARRALSHFALYLLGYHVRRAEERSSAWRTDPTGARRVG
jgi:hypothetical protein